METKFIDKEIKYTGLELAPHWIYRKFHMQGDAMVAFCGECEVKLTEMVDIEDIINNEPIYSKNMLSFIVEHFNIGLVEGVTRQRLLICIIKEELENLLTNSHSPLTVKRRGDDLFIESKKLSVSIATKSLTSVLIHVGININPKGAPIDAIGLDFLKILDINGFANNIMLKYSQEINDIILASTKVTGRTGE
jgi:uncharacterized protein